MNGIELAYSDTAAPTDFLLLEKNQSVGAQMLRFSKILIVSEIAFIESRYSSFS